MKIDLYEELCDNGSPAIAARTMCLALGLKDNVIDTKKLTVEAIGRAIQSTSSIRAHDAMRRLFKKYTLPAVIAADKGFPAALAKFKAKNMAKPKRPAKVMCTPDMEALLLEECGDPLCANPEHNYTYIVSDCHPEAGVEIRYTKGTGVLVVSCAECMTPVLNIGVALHDYRPEAKN